MTDLLVQFALSNLLVSALLAGVAYAVHRRARYPGLAHLLWVLVLLKLVTPPVLSLPMARLPAAIAVPAPGSGASVGSSLELGSLAGEALSALLLVWALGSMLVLAVSVRRIYRFDRILRRTSREAPGWVQYLAEDTALRLGLRSVPTVYVTRARIAPMTWWAGGRVRVLLPDGLARDIRSDQLAWVVGHELAHVKRHDHLVRWLEWLACVSFWWNPVAWWARQNLRLDEEASCDALVMDRLGPLPRTYALALLAVVEHLASPQLQPPAVATGIEGGVSLERRFRLIVASRTVRRAPRWLAIGLVGSVVALLPVGVGYATDPAMDDSRSVTRPVSAMSDGERALLSGERRAAAQVAWSNALRTEAPMAKLSAPVSLKSKGKGKVKQANDRKARKAVRAKRAKVAKRAKLAREARRDQVEASITRWVLEPVGRTTRQ